MRALQVYQTKAEMNRTLMELYPQSHPDYEGGIKIRKYPNYWDKFWHIDGQTTIQLVKTIGGIAIYRRTMQFDSVNEAIKAFIKL